MTFLNATTPRTKRWFSITKKSSKKNVTLQTDRNYFISAEFCPQPHSHKKFHIGEAHSKRSFLYTSSLKKGSITLEAAIAIPLFFLGLFSIIYIINIMYIQLTLQMALEETVSDVTKEAYISAEFYSMTSDEQADASSNDSSFVENLGATVISVAYIKNKFLTDDITALLDNSYVKNGASGVSFTFSSVDMTENIMDITINYKITIPFISSKLLTFNLSNRCYSRIYLGQDMEKEQKESFFYIYRAATSKVSHTNKYCQYLLNYSKAIRYNEIIKQHPINPCALCNQGITIEYLQKSDAIVYLTSDEEVYHVSLDCQSFTGDIFRLKRSTLEGEDICKKCLEGK